MKVLVAYASKRGSTAEIAAAVAETLRETGLEVDCRERDDISDVSPYDAIVLGSAVYMKRWRGDAKHFLRKHSKQLAERPLWVFSSGLSAIPMSRKTLSGWSRRRSSRRSKAWGHATTSSSVAVYRPSPTAQLRRRWSPVSRLSSETAAIGTTWYSRRRDSPCTH